MTEKFSQSNDDDNRNINSEVEVVSDPKYKIKKG